MIFERGFGGTGWLRTIVGMMALAGSAGAAELEMPQSAVVLTVTGKIAHTNSATGAEFDLGMLRHLPQTTIRTGTIWTDGEQEFRGVQLSDLLQAVGADGTMIYASAINDYEIEVPVADAVDGGPIIAYEQNGQQMSVRTQGPLWLVYPYDASADYQTEVIYARSIWQLVRMEITD